MFTLSQVQEFFWQWMQSPGGISEGSEVLGHPMVALFSEHRSGEAAERLENYSQMYFWRISDSLKEDFPLTATAAGEATFHQILVDFLLQSPSRVRDLAELSGSLPEFLEQIPLVRSGELPFIAELARLEWSLLAVQRMRDPRPLSREDLSGLPAESWAELQLKRIEASRILPVHWDLFSLWRVQQGRGGVGVLKSPAPKSGHLLIWRKDFSAQLLEITQQEADLLRILQQPTSFQELCEKIRQETPEASASQAAFFLQGWIERQLVERC